MQPNSNQPTLASLIEVTVTWNGAMVLGLDDPCILGERGLTVAASTRRTVTYLATRDAAQLLLDDFVDRSLPASESGFDQPASWRGIARANAKRVLRQLKEVM